MKSQDILLLLKLVSLEISESVRGSSYLLHNVHIPSDWHGWDTEEGLDQPEVPFQVLLSDDRYSVRGLEQATGISKSQISSALIRCYDVGLARPDRLTGHPRANTKGLFEFISHGLKYVFPARPGPMAKGIPTAAFAPVLAGQLFAGTDHSLVWEDPSGNALGQRIDPIHKCVPYAVRRDPTLYAMLALVDSIRVGHERESALSRKLLAKYLGRETI